MTIRQTAEHTGIYKTTRQSLERPLDTRKPVPIQQLADLRAILGGPGDAVRRECATWLADTERDLRAILDPAGVEPTIRADAEAAWGTLAMVRVVIAKSTIDAESAYWIFRLGREVEKLAVRPFELLVDKGRRLVRWHGRTCAVTKREHDILSSVTGTTEPLLRQVVKRAWGAAYQSRIRDRYDKAISRLNEKLCDAGIPWGLHVRGDRLVRDETPPA